jgi:SulP family sulfate permease
MRQRIAALVKADLRPLQLVSILSTGVVAGVVSILVQISFGALIFSGDLAGYVSLGIGFALFAATVMDLVMALGSSVPGVIAEPQDGPAALLALVAAAIAGGMPASATDEATFATVVAALALTSLLAGVFFLLLGLLKQGSLVRYIPFPVVGGFLAGTGWLLVDGSMGVMTDMALRPAEMAGLFQAGVPVQWLPGLLLAVLMLLLLRRFNHFLLLPGLVLGFLVVFYVALAVGGVSLAEARAEGWLLGPFPEGGLWRPLLPGDLALVHWPAIGGQLGSVGTILLVSVVSLLLNASGLELVAGRDLDLNRELVAMGAANCLASLGSGGPVGYHILSISALGYRSGSPSRLIGIIAAAMSGTMLLVGPSLLSYLPKMAVGGLLLFLGLDFLTTWLYDGWQRLSRGDYLVVVLILVAMATIGVLEGVGLGLGLAVVLFVVEYSRTGAVRHTMSGTTYQSKVDRPRIYGQLLRQRGDRLHILELQGFLFFGTAHSLLEQVRERLADTGRPRPEFVVLDFRRVTGIDASAAISFARMVQLAEARGFILVLTDLSPAMEQRLARELPPGGEGRAWRTFADLDHGVEWCEAQMIANLEEVGLSARPRSMMRQLIEFLPQSSRFVGWMEFRSGQQKARGEVEAAEEEAMEEMVQYMERLKIEPGQVLIRQGEASQGLYFVEEGQVTIRLEREEDHPLRLRTRGAGTVVGEVGLYRGTLATATVVVDQPGTAYRLTAEALRRMEGERPALAAAFHKFMAQHLSDRLADTTEVLEVVTR